MTEQTLNYQGVLLRARPGARYACAGDGLCCTNIHAIGSLTDEEVVTFSTIADGAVQRLEDGTAILLMAGDTGRCVFRTDEGCAVHATLGEAAKPSPCQRYPLSLTKVPGGARIGTEHRCPCRHVGDRPLLEPADVLPSLVDDDGQLLFEHGVASAVLWSADEAIDFADYAQREQERLASLAEGKSIRDLLGAEPFAPLNGFDWSRVGQTLSECDGQTRLEAALRWVGSAVAALVDRTPPVELQRPWLDAFEHAAKRPWMLTTPTALFSDWIADKIWDLRWTEQGSFQRACSEWATLLTLAKHIAARLITLGTPERLAIAEAITIVDVGAHSDWWEHVQAAWPEL